MANNYDLSGSIPPEMTKSILDMLAQRDPSTILLVDEGFAFDGFISITDDLAN